MGALSLLRAMCSAASASGSHSPDLPCDPLLKRGELFHLRNTRAPLPAAPGPSGRRCPAAASHHS
jgi:hypothetical protein